MKTHFLTVLLALLATPFADIRAQSPASIGGRTIQLTISSGSPPFASSGAYRFLPSATDSSYASVPISGPISTSFGTHTYAKTGPNTARLSFTDSIVGTTTADCTFSTENSGTYVLTGVSFPGSSQTGTFFLYSGSAPVSIAGLNIIVTVTSGAAPFATNGYFQLFPALAGTVYTLVGRTGVADSSGTFSYNQNSAMTGIISFTDSISGAGFSSQLSFASETTGTVFLRQSVGGGYQTGTFKIASPGSVVTWGASIYGLANVPAPAQSGVIAVAAGVYHTVVLKNDGSVLAWGWNNAGQTNVPAAGQSGVMAIAAGHHHSVALKTNGSVVAWGSPGNVPVTAQSEVAAIAAGQNHTVALKTSGMVVAWGFDAYGETTVPITAQSGVAAIAAGWTHTAALKTNGAVVAWGAGTTNTGVYPQHGQSIVPVSAQSGVIAVACGRVHTVALKTNGTVVAWGENCCGQTNVPAGLNGVVAIAAGDSTTMALRTNGVVVTWGFLPSVPIGAQSGVTAIATKFVHQLALVGTGLVLPVSLTSRQSGNQFTLSWPTTAVGFKLQSALVLTPPVPWIDSTNVPVIIGAQFTVTNANSGSNKFYRLKNPYQTNNLGATNNPAPTNMALIPAGTFTMGNTMDSSEGYWEELPLLSVYVSAFYMDQYDVTKALWEEVYNWALTHGYSFDYGAAGKAANHPVQNITWYDAVKWCNARSEKENKVPAYYTDAGLSVRYRSGQVAPSVNWSSGYRLPTEAEWEKAARGGASGQRFPWGNTISWSQANYYSYWPAGVPYYPYDVNPTQGYHPSFQAGGTPYTGPVDYFAPNGYGLYDMAGNVAQWCWDWWGAYSGSAQTDPRGPATGSYRVFRGSSWSGNARVCRSAARYGDYPTYRDISIGFRSILSPSQ